MADRNAAVTIGATSFKPIGKTGATQSSEYAGATISGAPVSGDWVIGQYIITQDGHVFICTASGTPGTWTDAGSGAAPSSDRAFAVAMATALG